jgi:hypothetical protein
MLASAAWAAPQQVLEQALDQKFLTCVQVELTREFTPLTSFSFEL